MRSIKQWYNHCPDEDLVMVLHQSKGYYVKVALEDRLIVPEKTY